VSTLFSAREWLGALMLAPFVWGMAVFLLRELGFWRALLAIAAISAALVWVYGAAFLLGGPPGAP